PPCAFDQPDLGFPLGPCASLATPSIHNSGAAPHDPFSRVATARAATRRTATPPLLRGFPSGLRRGRGGFRLEAGCDGADTLRVRAGLRDEDRLAVVAELGDGVADVAEGAGVAARRWRVEVGARAEERSVGEEGTVRWQRR